MELDWRHMLLPLHQIVCPIMRFGVGGGEPCRGGGGVGLCVRVCVEVGKMKESDPSGREGRGCALQEEKEHR